MVVDWADALDRLGLDSGKADDYLGSGEWVWLGRDRARLVPLEDGDPRAAHAWALVARAVTHTGRDQSKKSSGSANRRRIPTR